MVLNLLGVLGPTDSMKAAALLRIQVIISRRSVKSPFFKGHFTNERDYHEARRAFSTCALALPTPSLPKERIKYCVSLFYDFLAIS